MKFVAEARARRCFCDPGLAGGAVREHERRIHEPERVVGNLGVLFEPGGYWLHRPPS